jgi:hypothetical protein
MKIVLFLFFLIFNTVIVLSQYIEVQIDYNKTDLISSFLASVTNTQNSIDSWKNQSAIAKAKLLLENSTVFQNQHIMGWGALNPWPDSSVTKSTNWDWISLDAKINLIRETRGIPVITLCGCPTWMHTPVSNGQTLWGTSLEKAPTPAHFDDFAHLCAEVARRYPDVTYFQVWNELKGFWSISINRWRYEDYTLMYNMVYDSLKAINPDIKIGGPYTVVSTYSVQKSYTSTLGGVYGLFDQRPLDVIVYWLAHKKGADFIAIDGGNQNKDDISNCDAFQSGNKLSDIIAWINEQQPDKAHLLRIWWSEWYIYPNSTDPQNNADLDNAIMASAYIKTIKAGSANVLLWQPEGDDQGYSFPIGIWTSTTSSSGGIATPFYYTLKMLKENFSSGVELVNTKTVSSDISVIASKDKALIVNHRSTNINVRINYGTVISLTPYEVKLIDTSSILSSIPHELSEKSVVQISFNNNNDILYLHNLNSKPEKLNYYIYSLLGKMIISGQEEVLSEHTINLSMLSAGFYIYRIDYMSKIYCNKFFTLR